MIARRSFLRLAGVGAASVMTIDQAAAVSSMAQGGRLPGVGDAMDHGMGGSRPADAGTHPAIEKFSLPLPILRDARPVGRRRDRDIYFSRIREVKAEIYPGYRTPVYGYFGSWIPPVIRARKGHRTVVVQRNDTKVPVSVHLHGGVNREIFDGQMSKPIAPGRSFVYIYDNDQAEAALWLHDHTHHTDAENVYRGMSSPYLLTSKQEESLGLPSGRYEVPLMLRDGDFASDGRLVHVMDDTEHRSTILVNGTPWPRMDVRRRRYRLRIINSSAMRFFVLGLSDGTPMTQIGGDLSLLASPIEAPVVVVSPGERADVVIDFSKWKEGSKVDLVNYIGPGPVEDVGQVMRFRVGSKAPDDSRVPDTLTTLPPVPRATVKRTFTLESSEPGVTPMVGMINDRAFKMDRIDTTVKHGTTEEWSVTNANPTVPHNFHCHLAHMRVIDRDGAPVGPEELGLKDTVQIFPQQTVRVRLTFDTHRGVYPYHCHMLDHGAMGMMAQLKVV
ncbi:MAG: multicopper oxidase family protein [Ornithinimicrobium sp.]